METEPETGHLTQDELFGLALPAAGAPEPLPSHLSECLRCSRALADWKGAVGDLGQQDEEALSKRSSEEWLAAEEATLVAVRREGAPGRGRSRQLRWALPAAASLLLFALLVNGRNDAARVTDPYDDPTGLSAQDRADDALLRDVERLARGEENGAGWSALAPDPDAAAEPAPPREETS